MEEMKQLLKYPKSYDVAAEPIENKLINLLYSMVIATQSYPGKKVLVNHQKLVLKPALCIAIMLYFTSIHYLPQQKSL